MREEYLDFWNGFLAFRQEFFLNYQAHSCANYHFGTPRKEHWCNITQVPYLPGGVTFSLHILGRDGRLACYFHIDNNHGLFHVLQGWRDFIESRMFQAIEPNVILEWVGPRNNFASTYIKAIWNVGADHVLNHDNWLTYYGWMMRYLRIFDSVFRDVFHMMQERISPSILLDGQQRRFDAAVYDARADAGARWARLGVAPSIPKRVISISLAFRRNPDVVAEVLERAEGVCENPKCRKKAPFLRASDNRPYLEVHHKIPLAQGGEDIVKNAIALCPNCHRETHYGNLNFL